MSQENVEIARRLTAEINRTFAEGASDLYDLLDPEVDWVPITALLEGTRYNGHAGVRQWIEDMQRDWEVFQNRPEEFREIDEEQVLILGTWQAQGRVSGVELDFQQAAWLTRFRDGKLIRLQTFTNRELALETAGVRR